MNYGKKSAKKEFFNNSKRILREREREREKTYSSKEFNSLSPILLNQNPKSQI